MKETEEGLPWWTSGKDPVLPMQGAQVRSLVKELRSHISCSMAKKKKKKKERVERFTHTEFIKEML